MVVAISLADASKKLNKITNTSLTIMEVLSIWFRGL